MPRPGEPPRAAQNGDGAAERQQHRMIDTERQRGAWLASEHEEEPPEKPPRTRAAACSAQRGCSAPSPQGSRPSSVRPPSVLRPWHAQDSRVWRRRAKLCSPMPTYTGAGNRSRGFYGLCRLCSHRESTKVFEKTRPSLPNPKEKPATVCSATNKPPAPEPDGLRRSQCSRLLQQKPSIYGT